MQDQGRVESAMSLGPLTRCNLLEQIGPVKVSVLSHLYSPSQWGLQLLLLFGQYTFVRSAGVRTHGVPHQEFRPKADGDQGLMGGSHLLCKGQMVPVCWGYSLRPMSDSWCNSTPGGMGFSLSLTDSSNHGGQFCQHAFHRSCRCAV